MKKPTLKINKSIKPITHNIITVDNGVQQAYYPSFQLYSSTHPLLTEEDVEYFNKTVDLITKMMDKMGFAISNYSTSHSLSNITYSISGEFVGKPKDADDFVTLARRAILKGAINESSNKDSE